MLTLTETAGECRSFTAETITDGPGFANLKREWEDLLGASSSRCLFLTWEWLYTWWKYLAADRQPAILALRCGGMLAALAPFIVRPPSLFRGQPFQAIEFLGNGNVGSDYLDFIVHRGCEKEAVETLASRLAGERLALD